MKTYHDVSDFILSKVLNFLLPTCIYWIAKRHSIGDWALAWHTSTIGMTSIWHWPRASKNHWYPNQNHLSTRGFKAVSHPSTALTHYCLTSLIERQLVCPILIEKNDRKISSSAIVSKNCFSSNLLRDSSWHHFSKILQLRVLKKTRVQKELINLVAASVESNYASGSVHCLYCSRWTLSFWESRKRVIAPMAIIH